MKYDRIALLKKQIEIIQEILKKEMSTSDSSDKRGGKGDEERIEGGR